MSRREHVPGKLFAPSMYAGYRSDVNAHNYTKLPMIPLGSNRLTDLLQPERAALVVPAAHDLIFGTVSYGFIKLHMAWPGYGIGEPLQIDIYEGGHRPTRSNIASLIARAFVKYLTSLQGRRIHPTANNWYGIPAEKVIVNHLTNSYENVWQLDCDVLF